MRSSLRSVTALAATLLLAGGVVGATSVRIVNLVEMVGQADRIFWGRCLEAHPKVESTLGLPIVEYVFQVRRGLKGIGSDKRVVFRQVRSGPGGIAGVPEFHSGEEVLLFLHGRSRLGLTSPVGLGQGVFQRRPGKEPAFLNALANRNLLHGLDRAELLSMKIGAEDIDRLQAGGALGLQLLSRVVEALERQPGGKEIR